MNCYKPGEILLLPKSDRYEGIGDNKYRARMKYSTRQILDYYHETIDEEAFSHIGSFPVVASVPEGMEMSAIEGFQKGRRVQAAALNYYVRPLIMGEPVINQSFMSKAIEFINCTAISPFF